MITIKDVTDWQLGETISVSFYEEKVEFSREEFEDYLEEHEHNEIAVRFDEHGVPTAYMTVPVWELREEPEYLDELFNYALNELQGVNG